MSRKSPDEFLVLRNKQKKQITRNKYETHLYSLPHDQLVKEAMRQRDMNEDAINQRVAARLESIKDAAVAAEKRKLDEAVHRFNRDHKKTLCTEDLRKAIALLRNKRKTGLFGNRVAWSDVADAIWELEKAIIKQVQYERNVLNDFYTV